MPYKYLRLSIAFFIASTACLSMPGDAHAYINPGVSSYMIQVLIAVFLAMGFAIKTGWQSIIGFFKKLFSTRKNSK